VASGDVAVIAVKTSQTQRTLQTFYDGVGGGWGWRRFGRGGFGDATTTEHDYKVGTLVIDLYDVKTKQLIWRGRAQDTVSDKATQTEKNLDKGVAKMFKAFPPRIGKRLSRFGSAARLSDLTGRTVARNSERRLNGNAQAGQF
jgi:hypothetical protein